MPSDDQLPPGFRFHPTDEELLSYYLHRRVADLPIALNLLGDVDFYKWEPWELPALAASPIVGCTEWFFFTCRDRKYPTGPRTSRITAAGYWKATGRDRPVYAASKQGEEKTLLGCKKNHLFYTGRAPAGKKTDWLMHEYRLYNSAAPESLTESAHNSNSNAGGVDSSPPSWVLVRLMKRSLANPQDDEDCHQPSIVVTTPRKPYYLPPLPPPSKPAATPSHDASAWDGGCGNFPSRCLTD